jgi:hypothetical protein
MKRINVLMPIWKRPDVLLVVLDEFNFPPDELQCRFTFVVSPDDPYKAELTKLCADFLEFNTADGVVIEVDNLPLANKMNLAIEHSYHFNWDYLMNIGSDDILSDRYWDAYLPAINDLEPIIMMNQLIISDCYEDKHIKQRWNVVGGGRLIRRDILQETSNELGFIYTPGMNSGLDTCSLHNMQRVKEVIPTVIDDCLLVDLKTFTNINTYLSLTYNEHEKINIGDYPEFGNVSGMCAEIAKSRGLYR